VSSSGINVGPLAGINFSKVSFLVADDKAFFRDMVHTALMRAGAQDVKHASSIETAIELMGRYGQQIGCVISDWDMAPVGALELLRLVRCRSLVKTAPRTPVVILTARADAGAVKAAMAMDVNGFAVAPLSFEKLIKTVANAMNRTWELKAPSHYAAVPAVMPSDAPLPRNPRPSVAHIAPTDLHAFNPSLANAKPLPRRDNSQGGETKAAALKNVHMCILSDVQPGAILARDILDRGGHLLLKTGTELKSSLIARLRTVAQGQGESYHLWVGEREAP
jgi:DNA-binding NarL/FixJ family response regulator